MFSKVSNLLGCVLCLSAIQPAIVQAQAGASPLATFAVGTQPVSSLIQASDGNFYGVTNAGGANSEGSIYELTSVGVLSTHYSFTGGASDGGSPAAGLVQRSDGALYGTTTLGGANGLGTVFRLGAAGLTTLHNFDPAVDGNSPYSALVPAKDGNLYGILSQGAFDSATGNYSGGTIFAITAAGNYENLFSFAEDGSQGSFPVARLLQASDGNLWGTTSQGGANGYGTLFCWNATSGIVVVHSFAELEGSPVYGLAQLANSLYGVTFPALSGYGEIFAVNLSTHTFESLYTFTGADDGGSPASALLPYSDGNLYGTTQAGGASASGTFFRINANGTPDTLYSFPSETINTFADANLLEAQNLGIYFPLLEDATPGLAPDQMDGAGQLLLLTINNETAPPPVNLTATSQNVAPGGSAHLQWDLPNGASFTAQQCFAFSNPASAWTGTQSASGTAAITLANTGVYTFSLTCGGSATSLLTVSALNSSTTTLAAPATVAYGATATLTATVASTGTATGSVRFMVNGSLLLATVPVSGGKAVITASTKGVPAGTYSVQAFYSGDNTHAASHSAAANVTVKAAATTASLTATPQTVAEGAPVTLNVTVTSSAGVPTGSVRFLVGTVQFATANLANGKAKLTASSAGVAPGQYPVHVVYSGSPSYAGSTSPAVVVTVTAH
jgi:uncharacterized repeat protein (TIGR03803 family)